MIEFDLVAWWKWKLPGKTYEYRVFPPHQKWQVGEQVRPAATTRTSGGETSIKLWFLVEPFGHLEVVLMVIDFNTGLENEQGLGKFLSFIFDKNQAILCNLIQEAPE